MNRGRLRAFLRKKLVERPVHGGRARVEIALQIKGPGAPCSSARGGDRHAAVLKHQNPNTKHQMVSSSASHFRCSEKKLQTPSSREAPMSKHQTSARHA